MPDDLQKAHDAHVKKLEGKPTEDCPTCSGSGRRFRTTPAGPVDYGACMVCYGSGRVFADGVTSVSDKVAKPS